MAGRCNNDDGSEILITLQIAPAQGDHITARRGLRHRQKKAGQVRPDRDFIMERAGSAGTGKKNIDKFVESCTGVCPSHSLTQSVTRKVNVNVLLPNERENVLVSSVLGGNTTARYSLLLILTVHFVINTCIAYNNPLLF